MRRHCLLMVENIHPEKPKVNGKKAGKGNFYRSVRCRAVKAPFFGKMTGVRR